MSRIKATLNTDFAFHAEQRPLAGNQHASLVYGSYAHWPVHARALTARQLLWVLAHAPRVSAAYNHAAAVTQRCNAGR
jgi:hypothetical protein